MLRMVAPNVLTLDNSVVSDCGNTQLQGGDTYTARSTPTFCCQPDGVVSGTQPGGEPVRYPAPKGDSENIEDVCSDRGRAAIPLWKIRMTNDSRTDGGLLTSEPQAGADLSL